MAGVEAIEDVTEIRDPVLEATDLLQKPELTKLQALRLMLLGGNPQPYMSPSSSKWFKRHRWTIRAGSLFLGSMLVLMSNSIRHPWRALKEGVLEGGISANNGFTETPVDFNGELIGDEVVANVGEAGANKTKLVLLDNVTVRRKPLIRDKYDRSIAPILFEGTRLAPEAALSVAEKRAAYHHEQAEKLSADIKALGNSTEASKYALPTQVCFLEGGISLSEPYESPQPRHLVNNEVPVAYRTINSLSDNRQYQAQQAAAWSNYVTTFQQQMKEPQPFANIKTLSVTAWDQRTSDNAFARALTGGIIIASTFYFLIGGVMAMQRAVDAGSERRNALRILRAQRERTVA